jgi:hypothetical protein
MEVSPINSKALDYRRNPTTQLDQLKNRQKNYQPEKGKAKVSQTLYLAALIAE